MAKAEELAVPEPAVATTPRVVRADRATRLNRLRRALGFAFPYRRAVLAIFLITLVMAGVNAAEPLILKYLFDGLTSNGQTKMLITSIAILLGLGIFREIANGFSNWLTWHTRLGIHYTLLENTVERLHRMPLNFHRNEGVGAIMTRLDRGIQGFIGAVTQILFNVFPAILYLAISVAIMLNLNWKLALLVLCFVPLPAAIAAWAGPEQTRRERALLDHWAKIYSRFNEVLSGIVTVRSFTMEQMEKKRFLRDVHLANQVVIRGVGIDTGLGAATNLVVTFARIGAIALGGVLVLRGQITLGTLVAFLGYVGGLFGPVQGLTGIYQTTRRRGPCGGTMFRSTRFFRFSMCRTRSVTRPMPSSLSPFAARLFSITSSLTMRAATARCSMASISL